LCATVGRPRTSLHGELVYAYGGYNQAQVSKQDFLSAEGIQLVSRIHIHAFCSCDLNLDPMTLMYEFNIDIPKAYQRTKMYFLDLGLRKLHGEHYRQT